MHQALPSEPRENQALNTSELHKIISETNLDKRERTLATKVLNYATFGAPTGINPKHMPPIDVGGTGFIKDQQVGEQLADVFCTMLKSKFLAGPYPAPPLFNMRLNKMFPLVQETKVRPIINLSWPPGESFNDNVPVNSLRKVKMCTAPYISDLIRKCAGKAIMYKYDHISAYKCVPATIDELKYQGFRFLGKTFIELRQIFGSKPAVSHYDDLHLIMVVLSLKNMKSYLDPKFLARILDDLVHVGTSKNVLKEFHQIYTTIASRIGVGLAPSTGSKAYVEVDSGIALGIVFNSKEMTWGLPSDKQHRYITNIRRLLDQTQVSETELQEITGTLNYIMQLAPILKNIRHHIFAEQRRARNATNNKIILSKGARHQLLIWITVIKEATAFPLPKRDIFPPLAILSILSDAAGRGRLAPNSSPAIAAAAVTFIQGKPNKLIRACRAFFPSELVTNLTDDRGVRYGDKSNFLELSAVLLGIIHNMDFLQNNQVLLLTDSLPAMWAIQKGRSSTCLYSSTLTLCIATILQSLGSFYYVQHVPRVSDYPSTVSDALTRNDSAGSTYASIMKRILREGWPKCLQQWLSQPTLDDTLGIRIWRELNDK